MKKRKILSLLLSLCLLIGLLPTAALAADQTNAGAGIRIQYVDESYDKTTGIMKVRVQAKVPASTGITCIGILMSWDNTKLSLVSQYDPTYDYALTDGASLSVNDDAMNTIMKLKAKSGPPKPKDYTVTDGLIYAKDTRTALYTFHANTDPLTYAPNDAQTSGNWFDVYEVMFRVTGKPADPATVLNSDSLRIADVAKGDDAVMKGAFPANDIYSIYLTDNSDPARLYVLNRMSGCTATEVTGEKSLMTAPDTGTATYPGSTNSPSATTYTVSFDANGGTGTMADVTGISGSYTLPANGFTAPAGQQFKGWATSASGAVITGTSITVSADTTLYAIWEPIPATTYTVSFDANGGTGTMADVTGISGSYTLPANGFTAPSGKQFKGWATSASGTVITGTSITVSADTKLYAIWEPIPATEYTITFDVNGGSGTIPSQTTSGQKLSSLPTATRSGRYSFDGWYTAASGGTQITTTYTFSANTTVYAHWTYTGGGGGGGGSSHSSSYTITVDKTENGTITVSPKSASKGDTVTITVKPDKGYELEMLKALDKDGDALKLTEKNGKYTFKMPSGKVTVKGSFAAEAPEQIFFDVPVNAYYYEAVKWAAEKGITGGVGNGLFGPNQPCTRAQIVTFLWRAAGSPTPKHMSSFADVPADAFYAKAVAWAVENGITGGTGEGKFSPNATCTRAQSVTFLYRAAGSPKVSSSAEFGDVATNAYYADAVAWAAKNGITGGIGGGLFGSDNNCTRAQIVTFLYRSVK